VCDLHRYGLGVPRRDSYSAPTADNWRSQIPRAAAKVTSWSLLSLVAPWASTVMDVLVRRSGLRFQRRITRRPFGIADNSDGP
jgi:hypothetical protein